MNGKGLGCAIAASLLMTSCGGSPGTPPATPAPAPVTSASCSGVPASAALTTLSSVAKPVSDDDRRTRRGRVYEELWKHQASAGRLAAAAATVAPAATADDIGQIAVIRDEGDLILPAHPYDLRAIGVAFTRNGSGGYDARRSDRAFQSAVGDKIALGDDESASVTLPFTFPYYAGRYTTAFVNSDGNVTFGVEDHASTDRNVARFLTGPPRIAPIFDDLDPAQGGGVFRRIDGDALLLTWCDVPEFDAPSNRVTVQLRLAADGGIDFFYGATASPTAAVVGLSPGETGIFAPIDLSAAAAATAPIAGGTGAVGERFANIRELDFVALT